MSKLSPRELAKKNGLDVKEVIKTLESLGHKVAETSKKIDEDTAQMVIELLSKSETVLEQILDKPSADLIVNDLPPSPDEELKIEKPSPSVEPGVKKDSSVISKAPVVTVMGHVDHGKTTLLDTIRKTAVATGEVGGITQKIGAYEVKIKGRSITFIDTPGHEAFTSMRARGAQVTDLVLLVVAADEGVKPQTLEALNHAKAAKVPVMVVVNKIDKPGSDNQKIRQELSSYGLLPDVWGGDTVYVDVSAKVGTNIQELLDMVVTFTEILELKTDLGVPALGVIIESRMDKGRGPLATVILREGVLRIGDYIEADKVVGKIKSLVDSFGKPIKEVLPSIPVEISGFTEIPPAGSLIRIISYKEARDKLSDQQKTPSEQAAKPLPSLEEILKRKEQESKTVDFILKADSVGSMEALSQSVLKLSYEGISPTILHKDVGGINSSDVNLAYASSAIIVGFNVRPDPPANHLIEELNIPVKLYRIIYQALEDIENLLKGAVVKEEVEKVIGKARIQALFKVPKIGVVAGCLVISGKATRNSLVRVIRDGIVLREGKIASLRRFKDDAKEVSAGMECGIRLEGYQDFFENDDLEFFIKE